MNVEIEKQAFDKKVGKRRSRKRKKKTFFEKIDRSEFKLVEPKCPYFGICGGCSLQDIDYEDQLSLKKAYLKTIFKKDIGVESGEKQLHYRNRMDFVYSGGKLGLRKKGDFKTIVELDNCALIPENYSELYKKIKELVKTKGLESYDVETHEGFLRYITFRYAPIKGEVMVFFSTTSPRSDDEENEFVEFLKTIREEMKVDSLYWQINDGLTDTAILAHEAKLILGKKTIIERIGDLEFEISPWSFFQNNSLMSEKVFNKIKEYVEGETIDCCCGVGTIGLFVADKAKNITGIDEVPQSIELANKNKERNNIKKAVFFADDMKNLENYSPLSVDTIIIDPPRAGLNKKTIKKIIRLSPKKIIYMSCNPKTQKTDIELLEGRVGGLFKEDEVVNFYELKNIEGFDMFPQTNHLETIAILEQKQ